MEKILKITSLIIILLIIVIGFTGCGKKEYSHKNAEGIRETEVKVFKDPVFEAAKDAAEKTKEVEKEVFNEIFTKYEGNISAENVKQLFNSIKYSNEHNGRIVEIKGISDENAIKSESTYNVKTEKDSEGYVSVITIKEK